MNAREHAEAASRAVKRSSEIAVAEALVAIALALTEPTEPRPEPEDVLHARGAWAHPPRWCLSWSAGSLDPQHPRHACSLHAGHPGAHHCNTCGADWSGDD